MSLIEGTETAHGEPTTTTSTDSEIQHFLSQQVYRRRLRYFYDSFAKVAIATGGVGVIVAILLIFVYLLYEVIPLFRAADVQQVAQYQLTQDSQSELLHLAVEEQAEVGMRLSSDGRILFFRIADGAFVDSVQLPLPGQQSLTAFALESEESGLFALGFSDGTVLIARYEFETRFAEDGTRQIIPVVNYPFGQQPYTLFEDLEIGQLAIRERGDEFLLVAVNTIGNTSALRISQQRNLFSSFAQAEADPEFTVESLSVSLSIAGVNRVYRCRSRASRAAGFAGYY